MPADTLSKTIESVESSLVESYDAATATMSERFDEITKQLAERFETAEERLPALPKKVVAYNRVVADRAMSSAARANDRILVAVRPVVGAAETGVRTVVGTARWAAERTNTTALDGWRQTTGQARAQVERVVATFNREADELVEDATEAVVEAEKDLERRSLRTMTKAELYEIAQDLDIEGRGDMKKQELLEAIVAAS